jgi:hypothetical protein
MAETLSVEHPALWPELCPVRQRLIAELESADALVAELSQVFQLTF